MEMASLTMTASFLCSASQAPVNAGRRLAVVASAEKGANGVGEGEKARLNVGASNGNGRRGLMFAAAAASVCSVAGIGIAMAAEEPKAGTPEAKKFYAPVCVTMPTAKVCHK